MKLKHLIATGILAIAATGAGYYAYSNLLHPPLVTTSYASLAAVSEAVYGTGTVEPERWAKVVPLQRRRLVDLCRCEGQVVKSGQILGRQDDAEERSALEQMEINRGQLERDLARAEKDRDKNDATRTEYEQRWTKLEEAKSRIAAQKVRLDSLILRAPLDGMVLRRDSEVGEIAGPTDVLFWVGPPAPMQVVAEINEEEINRIAAGQKAFLRSEAFPGRALARHGLPDHAQGRPDPKDLPGLFAAATGYAAADRHVGRDQHHFPREAGGHRRAGRGRGRRCGSDGR